MKIHENSRIFREETSTRKEQTNQWFGNLAKIGNLIIRVSHRVYRMCWETSIRLHLQLIRLTASYIQITATNATILLFTNFPDRCIAVNERFADGFAWLHRRAVTARVRWNYWMQIRQLPSLTNQRNFWIARRRCVEYSAQQYRN